MVTQVHAGVADFERLTPELHDALLQPPITRIKAGAGAAGQSPPLHPSTARKVVCYTDGGCVENAKVNGAAQLAGAGCVILNDDGVSSRAALYVPVIVDPRHCCYLGALCGTNNIGELVGIFGEGVLWPRNFDTSADDVVFWVDSKYAAAVIEARWSFASNIQLI